ncbi:MAG: UvrD-helicase domain-containing protein [Planctomycetota bacterium]|nr:UvrD-helicase domain-containing protein [Planctomycetota bacterium]
MGDPIVEDLNPEQREAVLYGEGPLMVLAGAGSGKTRVITRRIARLMRDGVPGHQVLALTFTNKAAGEMARRVEQLGGARVQVSTFHSACARFLRQDGEILGYPRDYSIYDTYDRDAVLKMLMAEHKLDKDGVKPTQVGRRLSHLKNLGVKPDELVVGFSPVDRIVERLWGPYQALLMKLGALDFDDLIQRFLDLLVEHPAVAERYQARFRWLLVDEFQDTNRVQYDLLKRLVGPDRNITVVGDPDQSIYRFRGAEVRNILDFQADFDGTQVVRLEQNYRSTQTILRAAEGVISNNEQRLDKRLRTENDEGDSIRVHRSHSPQQEAREIGRRIQALLDEGVDPTEIAVFYRSHYLSRGIEEAFRELALPYQVVGGLSFFERREIKDLLSYVRVLVNPLDDVGMERIINVPPRGIGRVTLDKLRSISAMQGMSLIEVVCDPDSRAGLPPKVRKALGDLADVFDRARALSSSSVQETIRCIVDGVGYAAALDASDPEDQARIENIAELFNDMSVFDQEIGGGAAGYLEHVSLMTSEERDAEDRPRASMMSIHAAKGLEFDHVFVAGLEEGLFPSARSVEEPGGLEEERRLMYVALTRARRSLWLGWSQERMVAGTTQRQARSSFLSELPKDCVAGASASSDDGGEWDEDPWEDSYDRGGSRAGSSGGWRGSGQRSRGGAEEFEVSQEFEASYDEFSQELVVGTRVIHAVYGRGTVMRTAGRGMQAKATVAFDRGGERVLLLEYAGLRVLPGGRE